MCFLSRKKNASYIFIFVNYFKKKTFFLLAGTIEKTYVLFEMEGVTEKLRET